jgi:hypothetical protein
MKELSFGALELLTNERLNQMSLAQFGERHIWRKQENNSSLEIDISKCRKSVVWESE